MKSAERDFIPTPPEFTMAVVEPERRRVRLSHSCGVASTALGMVRDFLKEEEPRVGIMEERDWGRENSLDVWEEER